MGFSSASWVDNHRQGIVISIPRPGSIPRHYEYRTYLTGRTSASKVSVSHRVFSHKLRVVVPHSTKGNRQRSQRNNTILDVVKSVVGGGFPRLKILLVKPCHRPYTTTVLGVPSAVVVSARRTLLSV